jgi:hypothetical protein
VAGTDDPRPATPTPETGMTPMRWRYWNAMDTDGMDAADLAIFHRHYDEVHTAEVLTGNVGFLASRRYELVGQRDDDRAGPRWLAEYVLADADAADRYVARDAGPAEQRLRFAPAPEAWRERRQRRWRIIWRPLAEAGGVPGSERELTILGVEAGDAADAAALASRAAAADGARRATVLELTHDLTRLDPAPPAWLLAVEHDPGAEVERPAGTSWDRTFRAVRDTGSEFPEEDA